ncbi:(2,3-dihydroxybenzoyl)adenylate synthase [Arthrobacter antibioticus]|uniref:(2,3-dihydroxybenzoyl)adenylate synthase n=1 Tax=Arthrobacter sp. H35-MC1 TaxID=3046203 RepID=UPI0024B9232E|nr:AMP-binding protein [Arthrobacter sp. H35-MC1]MDJ0318324.1 AMP-binding protein [Arthrobacter sp. H35-MC1]
MGAQEREMVPWPAEAAELYRARGYWTGERLDAIAARHAVATPHRVALVDADERVNYADLEARVSRLAAGLAGYGIAAGTRVMLQLPNRVSFVVAALALMRAGAVPVYLLPAHRISELSAIAVQARPVAYIGPGIHDGFDYRDMAATLARGIPGGLKVIIDGTPRAGQESLDNVARLGAAAPREAVAVDTSDLAFLQLSGGTTGTPKLIPRTHDDYLYSVRRSVEVSGFDRDTVLLLVLPAAHNFPMSSPGFLGALLAGGKVVLASNGSPGQAFDLVEQEGVTCVPLVPPLALAWMRAAPGSTARLGSLKTIQVGGAKLLPEAARRLPQVLGARLQQVFGMAEGLVCYTREDDDEETVATTQGRPMSAADEVLVVDDDGNQVPYGTPGHLLTRGPYTIRGYYRVPEHNATAFTLDGYYRTGDIVRVLPGGHLSVEGRSKDQINRGGEKISAEEVEDHLLAHPGVHDAAIVAVADPFLGEVSCAVIVPAETPLTRTDILDFMRSRGLAAHKIPDRVHIVDGFPTTGVGKNSRADLRRTLAGQLAAVP